MNRLRTLVHGLVLGGLFLLTGNARAEDSKNGFVGRVYQDAEGKEHKYVLFVPHSAKAGQPMPLILFLHGAGEREGGSKMPVEVGLGPAITKYGEKDFPFFAIFPQCAASPHSWHRDRPDVQTALAILADVKKNYRIDEKRLYLTGLSMGGYGTWGLAFKYPNKWAAIVPICGGGDPRAAKAIKHIPCWCFHGDQDRAVPVSQSRRMIEALKEAGGKPIYTEYAGVGHNSWDQAYATRKLFDWLLKQRLK